MYKESLENYRELVCEAKEGRYDLTGYDLHVIEAALTQYLNASEGKADQTSEKDLRVCDVNASIYEFLYNSSCCESAAATKSIHKTKKGAEMAMEFHKNERLKEWEEECKQYPPAKEFPFDYDQWWGINESELLP